MRNEPDIADQSEVLLDTHRVLVLNASYEPLKIVNWRRGMLLFFSDKIDVLHSYSQVQVRSVTEAFSLPSVIRLKTYQRLKRKSQGVAFSRRYLFLRDDYRCQYCWVCFPVKDLSLDHVVPLFQGGKTKWTNVVTCCRSCNQKKGARTPEQASLNLYRSPVEPSRGFLLDLLYYKRRGLPEHWKPYVKAKKLIKDFW